MQIYHVQFQAKFFMDVLGTIRINRENCMVLIGGLVFISGKSEVSRKFPMLNRIGKVGNNLFKNEVGGNSNSVTGATLQIVAHSGCS